MTAFLLLLVVSAFAKDTFITLDSSRPLGLFVDVAPLNCSLVFTTDNVFFLKGTSILKSSPTNNLISDDASAQAVGLFVDPANKRVIAAIADDTGVLSFSSLTDCESPFVLLDGWTVPTEVKNLTSAVRVSADEVLFSGPSGKAVFVGWVQGTTGNQLGVKQVQPIPFNAGEHVWCAGYNDDQSLFLGVSRKFFDADGGGSGVPPRLITQDRSGSFNLSARIVEADYNFGDCPSSTENVESDTSLKVCGSITVNKRNIGTLFVLNNAEKPFLLLTQPMRTRIQGASFYFRNATSSPDLRPNSETLPTTFVQTNPNEASVYVVFLAFDTVDNNNQDISLAWLMKFQLLPTFNISSSRVFNLGSEKLGYMVREPMLVENSPGHQFVYSLLQNSEGSGILAMDTKSSNGKEDADSIVMMAQINGGQSNDCSLTKGQNNCPHCQACADIYTNLNHSFNIFLLSTSCQ